MNRDDLLRKARSYAYRMFCKLRDTDPEYRHCHESHTVAKALELTEAKFGANELGTFGVEGDCAGNGEGHIDIQYLNTGDSYEPTIIYWRGRFIVSSCGDIAERMIR